MHSYDRPTTQAIAQALEAHVRTRASETWQRVCADADEDERDSCEEVESLAAVALEHLEAGRWDEARACAEEALSLAESALGCELWREFGLLTEEAAETGRASADVLELS